MRISEKYDPLSKEVKLDQHSWFRQVRAECPVHHHSVPEEEIHRQNDNFLVASPTHEFWSVLTYAEAVRILQDNTGFSSKEGPGPERMAPMSEDGMLLYADQPAHRRQRRIASKAFLPRMVTQRVPVVRSTIDDLIDALAPRGHCDLMWELAFPLTITMITDFFGLGRDRMDDIARWGAATLALMGGTPEQLEAGTRATVELLEFVQAHIDDRRARLAAGEELPDDVFTALITAEDEDTGTSFTDEEIFGAAQQFLLAGFETTATAIGNGVYRLCTNPDERKKLEADWSLLETACEEILRYDAPVEGLFRTATGPQTLGGVAVPTGAKVRVVYASANRDPARFPDPDAFRIDRPVRELRAHLSFGAGPHACLGSALARTELNIALETIFKRLVDIDLDPDHTPTRSTALTVCGHIHIPVRWDPAKVRPRLWDDQEGAA